MAAPVAAPDASPPATVLLTVISTPRGKEVAGVAGDASLELQLGVPLVRQAADGAGVVA